jgi:hypothetical protein
MKQFDIELDLQRRICILVSKEFTNILPAEVWQIIGEFEDGYSRFEEIAPLPRKGADTFDYEYLPPQKNKRKAKPKTVRFGGGSYANTCYQNVVLQLLNRVELIMNPDPYHIFPGPRAPFIGETQEPATSPKTSRMKTTGSAPSMLL